MRDEKTPGSKERVELLREARKLTRELGESLSDRLDADKISPHAMIPYKARVLREALLHRTWELAYTACENFESGHTIAAYTLTRAALETATLVFMLHKKQAKAIDRDCLGDFDESFLMRSLFGRRDDKDAQYEALSVLTGIGHLDRFFADGCQELQGKIQKLFAVLCEHAHPNTEGTLGAYCHYVDDRHSEFGRGRGEAPIGYGVTSLCLAVTIARDFHCKLTLLEQPFRALCERDLP